MYLASSRYFNILNLACSQGKSKSAMKRVDLFEDMGASRDIQSSDSAPPLKSIANLRSGDDYERELVFSDF